MGDSRSIASLVSLTLDLPPSCVQFCPAHPEYFVVGTYNLEKNDTSAQDAELEDELNAPATKTPQSRKGSLVVFKLEGKEL